MTLNKEKYKGILFTLHPYELTLSYERQNILIFTVKNIKTGIQKEGLLTDQALASEMQQNFTTVQQIYSYFDKTAKQDRQFQKICVIDDEKIVIKWLSKEKSRLCQWQNLCIKLNPKKEELTPYEKLKRGSILQELNEQLNTFRASKMLKPKTDFSSTLKVNIQQVKHKQKPVQTISIMNTNHQECKRQISDINQRLDSMNFLLHKHIEEIQIFKEKVDYNALQRVFASYEKRQDSIISKLTKLGEEIIKLRFDKKQTAKKIEEQSSTLWEEVGRIREIIKTTTQINVGEVSYSRLNSSLLSDFNRQFESSIKSRQLREQTENSAAVSLRDRPIDFTRKQQTEQNTSLFMPNASFAFTEEEMQKYKLGVEDQSIYRKKIKELQKKIYSALPPTQLFPKFQKSKLASQFLTTNEKQGTLISKKEFDKKCQLLGDAFPNTGKVFFNVQLIQVPNGYIHIGVISGDLAGQSSSHDNSNCINYFGGNGSINDKGNGIFIGKQLKNNDIITVLVDLDLKKVLFILRGQLLGEASLKGLSMTKGLCPYLQLFYGRTKIKVEKK